MMSVTNKFALNKTNGKSELGLTKSWSLKEGLRALRRSLTFSSSQENNENIPQCNSEHSDLRFRHRIFSQCDVWRALSPDELPDCAIFPLVAISALSQEVFASCTGPNTGILAVQKWLKVKPTNCTVLESWKPMRNRKADGISVSLYEKNPLTDRTSGEPNADAFVVRARCDSAFLAVADGVNWGRDAMQAARCAIYAVYEYLESHLYGTDVPKTKVTNTREAAQLLFETFSAAQERIVACTSGLTTLCVALVLPVIDVTILHDKQSTQSDHTYSSTNSLDGSSSTVTNQFALIVVSVGDSQAFLLSKFHGIREVTGWVPVPLSNIHKTAEDRLSTPVPVKDHSDPDSPSSCSTSPPVRDFRDAGGALGAVYKNGNPELNNLMCAVTLCDPGDLVILGSDGLTDNFDPVITQIAVPESPHLEFVDDQDEPDLDSVSSVETTDRPCHPAKSWFNPLSLSPPPSVSIWPRPPPPPPSPSANAITCLSSLPNLLNPNEYARTHLQSNTLQSHPVDPISARNLNFTNQLELSWSERRRYAGKELERIWHETDALTSSPSGIGGTTSSRDLCEALIAHALRITAAKRELLQDPELARLRMNPVKLKQLSLAMPEEVLSAESVRAQRKWLATTLKLTPGKLDHATVVIYEIGHYRGDENEVYEETISEGPPVVFNRPSTFSHSEP
ncbi:hypothetical protein P879_04680 [Paragonimus westermani]|uniref:PPM-type phosphatase domain-containing protein n=1 Tax=Paragonimus westermani TaxID=34504 RepID=A0A8T0DQZ7_9TREM|nr:hypothetical protein P879_04680 [Paragonimus westermani]